MRVGHLPPAVPARVAPGAGTSLELYDRRRSTWTSIPHSPMATSKPRSSGWRRRSGLSRLSSTRRAPRGSASPPSDMGGGWSWCSPSCRGSSRRARRARLGLRCGGRSRRALRPREGRGRRGARRAARRHGRSGHIHFLWVSSPDSRHSRNVAERPDVSIVIFDSQVRLGHAQAVYISARAEEVAGGDLEAGVRAFSRESERWGGARVNCGACPGAGGPPPLSRHGVGVLRARQRRPPSSGRPAHTGEPGRSAARGDLLGGTLPARRELLPGRSRAGQRLG
jgi:hypothetical protein